MGSWLLIFPEQEIVLKIHDGQDNGKIDSRKNHDSKENRSFWLYSAEYVD